ncbi:aspartate kinase [Pendulispora albinea]|uniref:Aspartokinase n=1 Tax=Pendulispora albinea TaxID=2741071 RepID=A0ABZ2LJI9_9BACT
MAIIVQKYGGSSVADVVKIGQVADKIVAAKSAGHDVVVVVSAMGKTTDELLALARTVRPPEDVLFDPPRRELDMLVSTGERVSMALLSIAIHARGFDAVSFTGSQSGIMTNDRHFDARIIEVRPHRIEDELARGRIVIVAGYQGMSYKREITTLGRGGSDTTAVALAAALGAESCEIYSDVDGVYSADPRVVTDPKHLGEVDLATLQQMAESGAKVLNAQAVEWARRAKIAIYARRTADYHSWTHARAGLRLRPEDPREQGAGVGVRETVAHEEAITRVRAVVGLDRVVIARSGESLRHVVDLLGKMQLPLLDMSWSHAGASAIVPLLNVPDWDRARKKLVAAGVDIDAGYALVSIVGAELGAAALPRFLDALDAVKTVPKTLSAGPLHISAAIPGAALAPAQRALHAAFVDLDG